MQFVSALFCSSSMVISTVLLYRSGDSDVEKSRLRRTCFNASFHVKQMVGSGLLEVITTSSGDILRLAHRDENPSP